MAQLHILVVGAGVAGPILAYWLAKGGMKVTLIERSPSVIKTGQGIDIGGPGREVVRRMGLFEEMKARATNEEGFALLDSNGRQIAAIPGGLTAEIEILRGEMCEMFCDAADRLDGVSLQYGRSIQVFTQADDGITVTFNDGGTTNFDVVVGADGLRSRTRRLILDETTERNSFKGRDQYVAYFTIPRRDEDAPYSRFQNATDGRSVLIRPANTKVSSAYLNIVAKSNKLQTALREPIDKQKQAWSEIFSDISGVSPRVIQGMMESQDFYFEQIAQIKLDKWSVGRCTLVGDAAHAPSPLTGEGTTLAAFGAYILAGELTETPQDPPAAFARYEAKCRGYVEKAQKIPLGGYAPYVVNPKTAWGLGILRFSFKLAAWSGIWKLFNPQPEDFELPFYSKLN